MEMLNESVSERLVQHTAIQRLPNPKVQLYQCRNFLSDNLCQELIALIDANRRPSTLADDNGDYGFRTSETCDLPNSEAAVQQVEAAMENIAGIAPQFGEPLQGQRYAVGQEFKPHTDYFDEDGADFQQFCATSGQRTWTLMVYLNNVEAGGGTRFKAIKKTFQPEPGKLLCWNNRRPDTRVNPATLHQGMKVRSGVKYVLTKWYRERPWG